MVLGKFLKVQFKQASWGFQSNPQSRQACGQHRTRSAWMCSQGCHCHSLSCLSFLSRRMWLCHLCKSPSGGHRMPPDHPWAFPSPAQAPSAVSVPCSGSWTICSPELGSLQDHSWAGAQKPAKGNLPLLRFTSTSSRWAVTIDPGLRPQFPIFLFR